MSPAGKPRAAHGPAGPGPSRRPLSEGGPVSNPGGQRRGRVIALGQRAAGDDGVGLEVLQALRNALAEEPRIGPELFAASDSSELLELLCTPGPLWLVDALVGAGEPGQLLSLSVQQLSRLAACSVSSHGLGAAQAIELCRVLYPDTACPDVRIRAVSIEPPKAHGEGLSPSVAEAAAGLAALVLQEWQQWQQSQQSRGQPREP